MRHRGFPGQPGVSDSTSPDSAVASLSSGIKAANNAAILEPSMSLAGRSHQVIILN